MTQMSTIEERLERAETRLKRVLGLQQQLENGLREVVTRREHFRHWCAEVDEVIADSRGAVTDN